MKYIKFRAERSRKFREELVKIPEVRELAVKQNYHEKLYYQRTSYWRWKIYCIRVGETSQNAMERISNRINNPGYTHEVMETLEGN